MSDRQKILLSIVILVLFSLLLFIMFSDNGLADLFKLKSEKDRLLQENIRLKRENLTMYRTIERLKNDPEYIESIASGEVYIPFVIQKMLEQNETTVNVIPSDSNWFGITYANDKEIAMQELQDMTNIGEYRTPLWPVEFA